MGEVRDVVAIYESLSKRSDSELEEQALLLELKLSKEEVDISRRHALLQENFWPAYVTHLLSYL